MSGRRSRSWAGPGAVQSVGYTQPNLWPGDHARSRDPRVLARLPARPGDARNPDHLSGARRRPFASFMACMAAHGVKLSSGFPARGGPGGPAGRGRAGLGRAGQAAGRAAGRAGGRAGPGRAAPAVRPGGQQPQDGGGDEGLQSPAPRLGIARADNGPPDNGAAALALGGGPVHSARLTGLHRGGLIWSSGHDGKWRRRRPRPPPGH